MELNERVNKVKDQLLNTSISASIVFLVPALGFSIYRSIFLGWHPIFSLHIFLSLVVVVLFSFRKHLGIFIKGHVFLMVFVVISLMGMYSFLLTSAIHFIYISIILGTLIFGLRTGIFYLLVYLSFYGLIATLHLNDKIENNIDFNAYLSSKEIWISNASGYLFGFIILIYTISLFQKLYTTSVKNLEKSDKKYRSVIEGNIVGFIYYNQERKILDCNNSMCKILGYERNELTGMLLDEITPDKWKIVDEEKQKILQSNSNTGIYKKSFIHKEGHDVSVEVNINHLVLDGDEYYWEIVRDLSDITEMENRVFEVSVKSEEKERERYARELHDVLGPVLSTSRIYLNSLKKEQNQNKQEEYIERVSDLLNEAHVSIREISNNLSPDVLKKYGIVQAVRSFIEKLNGIENFQFSLRSNLEVRLKEMVEITLFRTLIELINNSIKHAGCTKIDIEFRLKGNRLSTSYSDNGIGFLYDENESKGFGLMNMQNRLGKIADSFKFITSPGKGVKVFIEIEIE